MASHPEIVVVGAGLSGLTAALRLHQAGARVRVLEAAARVGGQIHTIESGGSVVELGAEGFVARSEAVPALCRDIGIEAALIDQTTTLTYAQEDEGLLALAPGEAARRLGFQVPKEELGRGIRTLAAGMGELTDALASKLRSAGVALAMGAEVRAVTRQGERLKVQLGEPAEPERRAHDSDAGPSELLADGVVLSVPARAAAPLLRGVIGEVADELSQVRLLSSVTVTMAYARGQVRHSLEGSGIIVPDARQVHGFRALSFVTSKFARSGPEDRVLLRGFFRPTADDLASAAEADFAAWATERAAALLQIDGSAQDTWVSTWRDALPVYDDAYKRAVLAVETALGSLPIALAGSHFHGAGIDAAVRSADRASRILEGAAQR